jgi:hypothetical protein
MALCYGFGHVTPGLGTWRTQGYLVALLPLSLFFRFDVLVTVHLYDPLWTGSLTLSQQPGFTQRGILQTEQPYSVLGV